MKARLVGLICLGLALGPTEAATITTISIDGARGVYPVAINKNGEITGIYYVGSIIYSFVRTPNGDVTTFHQTRPGSLMATAIDAAGNVVGYGTRCSRSFQNCGNSGFVRAPDGTITHFTIGKGKNKAIVPCCIRSDGWIAGYSRRKLQNNSAFVRSPSGVVTHISLPTCSFSAVVTSMNLSDTVTGYCSKDSQAPVSGFVRTQDGNATVFGADVTPTGIDDEGVIVGYTYIAGKGNLGFIRRTDGSIETFGVTKGEGTYPIAINSKGAIAGYSSPGGDIGHGFVRSPNGRITTFDGPGASTTFVTSMNNQGVIIGYYLDQTKTHAFGFVRTP